MSVKNKFKIDMVSAGATPYVRAVQNDSILRVLEVELFADGVEYDLSGKTVSFAFKKPDGTSGWYDTLPGGNNAISVAENSVTISIAPQVLTVKGKVVAAVRVDDGVGRISTFPFIINVAEDPGNNAAESENYYSVQNWDDVNSAISELRGAIGSGGGGTGGGSSINDSVISPNYTWSSQKIDGIVGDIETALDAIIAIQESLIGGGSV